jgi:signal transduction histidine kinase
MNPARDAVRKLMAAVALMLIGVVALVAFLSRATAVVTATDNDITGDYAPSVVALDTMLADLRKLQRLLSDRASNAAASPGQEAEITAARVRLHRTAEGYFALPIDPGEASLVQALRTSLVRLDKATDALLAVPAGTANAHPALSNDFELARLALDSDIVRATDFNADLATRAAAKSARVASTLIPTAVVLSALSVGSAAAVLALAYRSVVRAEGIARESRQALEQRAEELEAFAGRVAHDLLSPLMTVGLAIDLAKRDSTSSSTQTVAALARASTTIERVRHFVTDLLEFSRAGAVPPPGVRTGIDEVVQEVAEEFGPVARQADAALEIEHIPFRYVRCSPGVLGSVLSNLVQNAIKYLGDADERKVTIRGLDLGSEVRIEVEDTGPGIDETDQRRLFEPYARGRNASAPGLGIGLATVRKLAESHGGHVGVRSQPGHGALFWITFPIAP